MEIDARGSGKSLSFCCINIDNIFCVSRLTREGLGTTNLACIASERNSIGVDIDPEIVVLANQWIKKKGEKVNTIVDRRISDHLNFIESLSDEKKSKCYTNEPHNFLVKTRQETALKIKRMKSLSMNNGTFISSYED